MAQATETFAVGADQFTAVVEIDLSTVWLISGDFSGTIPSGQVGFINGDVNLTGDLIVEGLLTGIDTFTLTGNGFQILAQNGGVLDLAGVSKSGWVYWGDTPTDWVIGDRLAVAPTAVDVYLPSEMTWDGSWGIRPVGSPDVTLVDGSIARPEVANLSRSIVLQNLRRIHFHDGAGIATLKWLKVLDSGTTGVLADYPIHFHLNGEASRGSLVEGVVVEGGKNHAFVAHGSHGVTFRDCVAYSTTSDAYWWDPPFGSVDNDSNDVLYDRCLALWVKGTDVALAGFLLVAGVGNRCLDSVAAAVWGGASSSGFHWPSKANQRPNLWEHRGNVAHNNRTNGIFVWQNDPNPHVVEQFTAYRNRRAGISHGAYNNRYTYRDITITGSPKAIQLHALGHLNAGPQLWERIHTDSILLVESHNQTAPLPTIIRDSTFTGVTYEEWNPSNPPDSGDPSVIHFEDCGLVPANFIFTRIDSGSVIEIYEAGVLEHRWASGVWN